MADWGAAGFEGTPGDAAGFGTTPGGAAPPTSGLALNGIATGFVVTLFAAALVRADDEVLDPLRVPFAGTAVCFAGGVTAGFGGVASGSPQLSGGGAGSAGATCGGAEGCVVSGAA